MGRVNDIFIVTPPISASKDISQLCPRRGDPPFHLPSHWTPAHWDNISGRKSSHICRVSFPPFPLHFLPGLIPRGIMTMCQRNLGENLSAIEGTTHTIPTRTFISSLFAVPVVRAGCQLFSYGRKWVCSCLLSRSFSFSWKGLLLLRDRSIYRTAKDVLYDNFLGSSQEARPMVIHHSIPCFLLRCAFVAGGFDVQACESFCMPAVCIPSIFSLIVWWKTITSSKFSRKYLCKKLHVRLKTCMPWLWGIPEKAGLVDQIGHIYVSSGPFNSILLVWGQQIWIWRSWSSKHESQLDIGLITIH
jgi:hypothetical protein